MTSEALDWHEQMFEVLQRNRDSWEPTDLNDLPDKPPIQPTLGGTSLLYPGKRHVFSGPPESAKTLAAYALLINTVRQGGTGILIDFEMGGYDARTRLRELGATSKEIARIGYVEPEEQATPERVGSLIEREPQLVLIDAAAGAYALEGLDENKRTDVERFARAYVWGFWRAGIASLVIDHVVKAQDGRGSWIVGSERKLGAVDVHVGFETLKAVSRGGAGIYKLTTHKDRGGYLRRGHLADLHLASDPDTHEITWTFTSPITSDDNAYFRPTHLMEKVSVFLELQPEPQTRTDVAQTLGGTKQYVLQAINALAIEGFVEEVAGDGRSKLVKSVRPYREDDPACNQADPDVPVAVTLCSSET